MYDRFEKVASATLTAAALALVALFARREFRATQVKASDPGTPTYVSDWGNLLAHGRLIGNPSARARIIEFADLECPSCRGFNETITRLQRKHPDDVALIFIHYPLAYHRFAIPAARAVECAHEAGRFAELASLIYEKQDSLGLTSFPALALRAGVNDTSAFSKCLDRPTGHPLIAAGLAAGKRIKIRGTPTVILNGWMYAETPNEIELARDIEQVLAGKDPFPRPTR